MLRSQDDADGNYAGFDTAEFTSQSGGKAAAVRHIKVHHTCILLTFLTHRQIA